MNKNLFKVYICRPYCVFFKEEKKEDMSCMGAQVVEMLVGNGRIDSSKISRYKKEPVLWEKHKKNLETYVCSRCSFREQDCDFQSENPPDNTEPCGGFILLALLKENNMINESDMELSCE
ncbi:MAG: hypothetical protein FP814_12880 [Desulfobacterium sp.]|nr:hypothetical protein [Desulfobacterium sp.]MBU3948942.1 hypothetical protein [Pseudomonadota bacterium]MBU4009995.1 hypothetical protein [Pseudomonadota bacterium]MBU4035779.1 hypothetical protein [Pseudomonadota bacterium]